MGEVINSLEEELRISEEIAAHEARAHAFYDMRLGEDDTLGSVQLMSEFAWVENADLLSKLKEAESRVVEMEEVLAMYAETGGTCVNCGCQKAVHGDGTCALDDCAGFLNIARAVLDKHKKGEGGEGE